jgi:hypothetical protein
VCAPARTSIRTGCTIERTGIQHNDLIYEYVNGELFTKRVEALEGLDHILVEQYGYVSEYYGKWHIPDKLLHSKNKAYPSHNIVHYNDYSYEKDEFYFMFDNEDRKMERYLEYFHDELGVIERELEEGQQYDTYTGYPYTPIQLDSRARHQSPTGTPLTENRGFELYEITQPNVLGRYSLDGNYTPSHFTGTIAVTALQRLLSQSDPWLMTVSFHSPHPPMVPASAHLDKYWNNRDLLFVSPSIGDEGENSAYGGTSNLIPDYTDPVKVQEWTALYYALIEEIDDYVGQLLEVLEADDDAYSNTLVVFTSDHGEMLGAHGKREKNNFYEESSRVPLFMAWPGKINAGTVVSEKVSHLDVFATILDYVGASESDHSDGRTLRPFIEAREVNIEYDEDVVFAEWDFRKPPAEYGYLVTPSSGSSTSAAAVAPAPKQQVDITELEDGDLDRSIDDRPAFLVRKGSYKLMMQKIAGTDKLDMMYNLDDDPYEVSNLIGLNGMVASNATIAKAEYMRCLLLGWMERMNGDVGYYSDPAANYGEGLGDISEVRNRQSWRPIGFWTSTESPTGLNALEFGRVAWTGLDFIRHEHLFLGTRLNETVIVTSVSFSGGDADLFSVDRTSLVLGLNACESIRVTFASTSTLSVVPVDAWLVLNFATGNTVAIQLILTDYDFESQLLGYPPPPTASPTTSQAPSDVPTASTQSPTLTTGTPSPRPNLLSGTAFVPPVFSNLNITFGNLNLGSLENVINMTDSEKMSRNDNDQHGETPLAGAPFMAVASPSVGPASRPELPPDSEPREPPFIVSAPTTEDALDEATTSSSDVPSTRIAIAFLINSIILLVSS